MERPSRWPSANLFIAPTGSSYLVSSQFVASASLVGRRMQNSYDLAASLFASTCASTSHCFALCRLQSATIRRGCRSMAARDQFGSNFSSIDLGARPAKWKRPLCRPECALAFGTPAWPLSPSGHSGKINLFICASGRALLEKPASLLPAGRPA